MFGNINNNNKKMFIILLTNIVNASNHTKCISLSNKNVNFKLLLLIYIIMNIVKNYTTIHMLLNQINVMEVVIFGKVCVPNKTEDLNIYVFNMIARKNDIKILTKNTSCNSNQNCNNNKC